LKSSKALNQRKKNYLHSVFQQPARKALAERVRMYLEFYGLREMPFGLTPDPKFIFKTESHLEVLATIRYAVEHNKGLLVVTGEVGTGKTTTLRAAMQQFTDEVQC